MNNLMIFNNNKFGEIRALEIENKIYFVGNDAAKALKYKEPHKAITRHCRGGMKHPVTDNSGRKQQMLIIPEGDLFRLVTHSELPSARDFESWVYDEVLPTIRKTGSYSAKQPTPLQELRVKIMERNAKVREAKHLAFLAEKIKTPEYQQVLYAKSAEAITGEKLLPVATRKTYSAGEIGQRLGISSKMVGRIANANNLKIPEYGSLFHDKSAYSDKQVETWRYYENVIPVLENIINKKLA